jgi:Na+-translocating ferredoxin:NAD+ oxidoreductase RNF subunit RnfB
MTVLLITALFAAALAFVLGVTLGFFGKVFFVPVDPLVKSITDVLPGANCGACGYPGCGNYAEAVAAGTAPLTACTVGGASVVEKLEAITGKAGGEILEIAAVLACQGSPAHAPERGTYTGIPTCRSAKLIGGTKLCSWGCYGFGDCVKVCKFEAIEIGANQLPKVNNDNCVGCGVCAAECPQALLKMVDKKQNGAMPLCSNRNPVKQGVIKTCKIACIKCGLCVKNCPEKCINLDTHIPVVDLVKCTSCGACVEKCPTKVFKIIQKDIM